MSAPQTNPKTQARRNLWSLIGLGLAVAFALAVFLLWLFDVSAEAPAPEEIGAQNEELLPSGEVEGSVTETLPPGEVEQEIPNPTIDPTDEE